MLERFPIDELLERLHAAGFEASVADQLRAFRLLEIIGETATRDELRLSLRPLFTSSEDEQQRFDDVFLSLGSVVSVREASNSTNAATAIRPDDRAGKTRPGLSRRTWITIASACVMVAILALAARKERWLERTISPQRTDTAGPTDTSTMTPVTTSADTTSPISTTHTAGTASETISTGGAAKTPEKPPVSWALLGAFISFLLAFGMIADGARWLCRRYDSRGIAGHSPPFEFQRPPDSDAAVFESQPIQQAATALRGRLAGERLEVDLRRTIRATVDGGGFPNFHYFGPAQSPEYLALIDRRSPDDHLATYFQLLVDQLTVWGAAIDIYTFEGDPRICTARDGTIVEAAQLRAERPTAKLLLFTDAGGLLDARTGVVHSWVDHGLGWDQRALLVPSIPQPARVKRLSAHFAVERADAAGLLQVAQRFASTTVTQATPASDAPAAEEPSLAQLRRVLPAGVFRWLTACAVQRSLEWNATVAVGRVAYPDATEKELLELVRLGWFRYGSIPEAVREELLAILAEDAALARAARNAVAQELRRRSAEAPQGSFAAEILLVEAVAHALAFSDGIDPKIAGELRRVDPELVRRDDDLPHLLAPDRATPSRWSRLRFRGGFPALGASAVAYSVLMVAFAVLVALGGGIGELRMQKKPKAAVNALNTAATDTRSATSQPDTGTTGSVSSIATSSTASSLTTSTTTTVTTSTTDTRFTSSSTRSPFAPAPTPTPAPTPAPTPMPPKPSTPVLADCFAMAESPATNLLDVTFTKCGEFVPRVGETVELSSVVIGNAVIHAQTTQVKGLTVSVTANDSDLTSVPDLRDVRLPGTLFDPLNYIVASGATLLVRGVRIPITVGPHGWNIHAPGQATDTSSPSALKSVDTAVPVDKFSAFLSIVYPQSISPSDVSIMRIGSTADNYQQWQGPTQKLALGLWSVRLRNDFYDEAINEPLIAGTNELRFHDPTYGIVVFAKTAGMSEPVISPMSAVALAMPKARTSLAANGDLFLRAQAGEYVVEFTGIRAPIKVVVTPGRRTTMEVLPQSQQSGALGNGQSGGHVGDLLSGSTGKVTKAVPRTSFAWDGTEDISNTWLHTEWTLQPHPGWWHQMQEHRGNVSTPKQIDRHTFTWREMGRATVDGTSGVIVRDQKSSQEVFIPDLNGGKNPSVVLIRANSKSAWQILVDLSVDHRL